MSDRVERPSLSIKRASRRDATAPYLSRRDSGANSTGLTNELKDKAHVLDFDDSAIAESSRQDSVASSTSASGSTSKKEDSGKKGMKSRMASMMPKRKDKEPETVLCTLVRTADGFGLWLNDHNRVTAVNAGSSAEAEGVRVFDRIMRLDGAELRCKLEEVIGSRSSLALTLERPPLSAYRPIVAQESQPNSDPYEFSSRPKSKSRGDSEPEPPKPAAGKEHAGKQQITAKLERAGDADSFGIEISPMNTITAVTLGGSGERAGLLRGDQVIKLNGKKCVTAVTEMSEIKKTSLELVVVRGAELTRRMSITPIAVSADL